MHDDDAKEVLGWTALSLVDADGTLLQPGSSDQLTQSSSFVSRFD
jgi:hypothetical protein